MHNIGGFSVEGCSHGGHRTEVHLRLGHVQGYVHPSSADEDLAVRNLLRKMWKLKI